MIVLFEISALVAFICIGIDLFKPLGYPFMKWCFRICIVAALIGHSPADLVIAFLLVMAYRSAKRKATPAQQPSCTRCAN